MSLKSMRIWLRFAMAAIPATPFTSATRPEGRRSSCQSRIQPKIAQSQSVRLSSRDQGPLITIPFNTLGSALRSARLGIKITLADCKVGTRETANKVAIDETATA